MNISKKFLSVGFFIVLCLFFCADYSIAAEYVLPYPSYMPGNMLYTVSHWIDTVQKYWHFGDIAGLKYNRTMSDKYLIEAKTLFEYKQYKLAVSALQKSNEHFTDALVYLIDVNASGKDNGEQAAILRQSADQHNKVIAALDESLPDTIVWNEEQKESEELSLIVLFIQSRTLRDYAYR